MLYTNWNISTIKNGYQVRVRRNSDCRLDYTDEEAGRWNPTERRERRDTATMPPAQSSAGNVRCAIKITMQLCKAIQQALLILWGNRFRSRTIFNNVFILAISRPTTDNRRTSALITHDAKRTFLRWFIFCIRWPARRHRSYARC